MPATQEPVFLKPRIEEFLSALAARNDSQHTLRAYRSDLETFIALCGGSEAQITEVNRKLIRSFIAKLHDSGLKNTSLHRKLAAVKSFCKWLEAEGLLDAGLVETLVPRRRHDQLPDVPSETDVKKLLDSKIASASPERDRVILELLYSGGLRASEVVGINIDDFREDDALVIRGKGRRERQVVIGEFAQAAVRDWLPVRMQLLTTMELQTAALLFGVSQNRSVERLAVRSIGRIVKAVAEGAGLDPVRWHPHLLRHACATHMHDHDAPLQAVAALLGHARLSTSQVYTRVSIGRMMQTYNRAHPHAKSGTVHR